MHKDFMLLSKLESDLIAAPSSFLFSNLLLNYMTENGLGQCLTKHFKHTFGFFRGGGESTQLRLLASLTSSINLLSKRAPITDYVNRINGLSQTLKVQTTSTINKQKLCHL